MEYIELKNNKRRALFWWGILSACIAVLMLFAIIISTIDLPNYTDGTRFVSVTGEISSIEKVDGAITIKLKDNEKLFRIFETWNPILTHEQVIEKIQTGDNTIFLVSELHLQLQSPAMILSLQVNGTLLYSAKQTIAAYKTYHYINIGIVSGIFALAIIIMFALFILSFTKQKKIKSRVTHLIQKSVALQQKISPIRKKFQKWGWIFLASFIPIVAMCVTLGLIYGESIKFYIPFVTSFILFITGTFVFFGIIDKKCKKEEIALAIERLNFKPGFPSEEPFTDMITGMSCAFSKNGMCVNNSINVKYDALNFYTEASYSFTGDMMLIFIVGEVNNYSVARELFNHFGQSEATMTNDDMPFFMFLLNEKLFSTIKHFNVNVKDIDELLSNREKLMKENCTLRQFLKNQHLASLTT